MLAPAGWERGPAGEKAAGAVVARGRIQLLQTEAGTGPGGNGVAQKGLWQKGGSCKPFSQHLRDKVLCSGA